ncbi:MAG: hypothetical protein KatS3mg111_2865 [Pirellulaceae bacterium]|nr:MAG: hypothetical protein KatS3mg111_2865 [Pirellulaceae bacterium]
MSHATPLVSVILPVYNAENFLIDAVASILEQTWQDFELICIDDGSTDSSPQILRWLATQDSRIRVITQSNQGIVAALNHGCQMARGPLLARMDADDVAFPQRLQRQVAWFQQHPRGVLVGAAILEIDEHSAPLRISSLPRCHEEIESALLSRRTGVFHPTVMMRADQWRAAGGYRPRFEWVEDHDLWLRLAHRGELANLPEVLLAYRMHAQSICWRRAAVQRERMNQLLSEAYAARGLSLPAHLLQSVETQRSTAGPGKWARVAMRGGFVRTALKHWRRLLITHTPLTYRLRMSAELSLRLLGHGLQPWAWWSNHQPQTPTFPHWHARWKQSSTCTATVPSMPVQQVA